MNPHRKFNVYCVCVPGENSRLAGQVFILTQELPGWVGGGGVCKLKCRCHITWRHKCTQHLASSPVHQSTSLFSHHLASCLCATRSPRPPPTMADIDLDLRCPICLSTFTCPSTLSCGHSFCLACLEDAWRVAGNPTSCPQCRAVFPVRPQLKMSVALASVVERRRLLRRAGRAASTPGRPVPRAPHLGDHVLGEHVPGVDAAEERSCGRSPGGGGRRGHGVGTVEEEGEDEAREDSIVRSKARISGKFARMRARLHEDEEALLRRAHLAGHELLVRVDESIARYTREVGELQAAANRLRDLGQESGSLTALRGHMKMMPRSPPPTPPPSDLSVLDDMSWLSGVVEKFRLSTLYGCSPTLDPNLADNKLQISLDLHTMTRSGGSQAHPHGHPQRIDWYYEALCSESFSSGQHYWEVDVGGPGWCQVGVAYRMFPRKGRGTSSLGSNRTSWILWKNDDGCSACHGGVKTSLSVERPPRRVGVYLDWDAGLLSFYRTDTVETLHSFRHAFARPLHPVLCLGDDKESLTILDLSPASAPWE
ncbi:E3 ubiquitin-protein ligase TRIM11-like isoform X2 [Lampetra planeri]